MPKYIQRKDSKLHTLETVDEVDKPSEAVKLLREYQMSDPSAEFYISSRPCKDWKNR